MDKDAERRLAVEAQTMQLATVVGMLDQLRMFASVRQNEVLPQADPGRLNRRYFLHSGAA